ncbi:MAG: hypothetical protein ABIH41_04295, partial [Nanoarchaeota archaeon]
ACSQEATPALDDFARCLTQSGATMYGASWCPHCNDQKEMFGSSVHLVNYVECATPDGGGQTVPCQAAGITAYPTWIFGDGTQESGLLTFAKLSEKTGCTAP